MAHLRATGTDGPAVIDLDLTDEDGVLVADYADRNPAGVRSLLAALDLGPNPSTQSSASATVMDLAVYRATGDRRLAAIFGSGAASLAPAWYVE